MRPRDLPPRISDVGQEERSGPISRVLSWASIYLGLQLPAASCGQPGTDTASGQRRSRRTRPLFGLAPGGVWPASVSPHSWCALTAPFHPCPPSGRRCVSVPLSVGSPRLGVTQRPALWSSDFPQPPLGSRGRSAHSRHIVAHSATVRVVPRGPDTHTRSQRSLRGVPCLPKTRAAGRLESNLEAEQG